jgi:RHS repeat-associated protein
VEKTVSSTTTKYTLDMGLSLWETLVETTGANATRYLHTPLGLLAQQRPDASWQWALGDGFGSVRGMVNSSLAPPESRLYTPYGEPSQLSGSAQNAYGFTGEPTDSNALVYLRGRYYHPGIGQFINLDPLETANRYGYVGGNPINRVDPNGFCGNPINWSDPKDANCYYSALGLADRLSTGDPERDQYIRQRLLQESWETLKALEMNFWLNEGFIGQFQDDLVIQFMREHPIETVAVTASAIMAAPVTVPAAAWFTAVGTTTVIGGTAVSATDQFARNVNSGMDVNSALASVDGFRAAKAGLGAGLFALSWNLNYGRMNPALAGGVSNTLMSAALDLLGDKPIGETLADLPSNFAIGASAGWLVSRAMGTVRAMTSRNIVGNTVAIGTGAFNYGGSFGSQVVRTVARSLVVGVGNAVQGIATDIRERLQGNDQPIELKNVASNFLIGAGLSLFADFVAIGRTLGSDSSELRPTIAQEQQRQNIVNNNVISYTNLTGQLLAPIVQSIVAPIVNQVVPVIQDRVAQIADQPKKAPKKYVTAPLPGRYTPFAD